LSRRFAVFFALALLGISAVPSLADAKRRSLGSRTLVEGMRGTDVRVLQDYLSRAGFRVKVDGEFGRRTSKRVRAWESAAELPVDAKVTRPDSRRLRSEVESGGASYRSAPVVTDSDDGPIEKATIASDGTAVAPASAPEAVKAIIAAGNEIHDKPYKYGGGHGDWTDSGYDCSGSVSYALHGANLLDRPMASGDFMSWGKRGKGQWVTTYAHGGHMYMVVAGLRFDTSGAKGRGGNRWTTEMRSSSGYTVRHPAGL
jgi:hypothetical protein